MVAIKLRNATAPDLPALEALNKESLRSNLTPAERELHGFVLKIYPRDLIEEVMNFEPVLIAEINHEIAGFVYPTADYFKEKIPRLGVRLSLFDSVSYNGKELSEYRYVELGMVVVSRKYRRLGVHRELLSEFERRYAGRYQLVTARVPVGNNASLRTHTKAGFQVISEGMEAGNRFHILIKPLNPHPRL